MTKNTDRLIRSHTVAWRLGYVDSPVRTTLVARPKTPEEKQATGQMRRFYQALAAGLIPAADLYIGKNPAWRESTIDAFIAGSHAPKKRGRPSIAKAGATASEARNA